MVINNPDGTLSLSRLVFASAWIISLASIIAGWFGGPTADGGVIASVLTPAGLVYTARCYAQGKHTCDPKNEST